MIFEPVIVKFFLLIVRTTRYLPLKVGRNIFARSLPVELVDNRGPIKIFVTIEGLMRILLIFGTTRREILLLIRVMKILDIFYPLREKNKG